MGNLIKGFWSHLTVRRKRQLFLLFCLMVLTSFADVLSLGAVLPFLGALTQPEKIFAYQELQPFFKWLQIGSPEDLLFPITMIFVFAVVLAGGMRLLLLYVQTRVSFSIGADLSYQVYRRTLYQPYSVHLSRNSSEIISGVTTKIGLIITYFLNPILVLSSSVVILIAIMTALLAVDPLVSSIAFLGFGAIYLLTILITRRRLAFYSKEISTESNQVVKVLQEGLGGIRDVLIDGTQEIYCKQYRMADIPLRRAQAGSAIIGGFPRYAVEALGMSFIAILAYILSKQEGSMASVITLLGVLALGAQRLLPVLQQAYVSIVQLRSGRESMHDALKLLNQPVNMEPRDARGIALPYKSSIDICDVDFNYAQGSPLILSKLNFRIQHGSCVGFIGATGSGKSTLLDVLMGLLVPTGGRILIDGVELNKKNRKAWQRLIAHVPQSIYLTDASIIENIAFGVPADKIDRARALLAAQQAQISSYIEALEEGYETKVGERGVRLSGGQRQRIGIARALYKQAEVIIFDEATSALDNETEAAVMDAIARLKGRVTLLIVAHRLSTLNQCDSIFELKNGHIGQSKVRLGATDIVPMDRDL